MISRSALFHRTAVKHTPCKAWKCSDTRRHSRTTTKLTYSFCQENFLLHISVELIDFAPQKTILYLTYPLQQNATQKEHLGSPLKPWERHHQQPCCCSPGLHRAPRPHMNLAKRKNLTPPACTSSKRLQQFHTRAGSAMASWQRGMNKPRFAEYHMDIPRTCKTIILSLVPLFEERM